MNKCSKCIFWFICLKWIRNQKGLIMMEFYICRRCGNLVEKIVAGGGELVCCGEPMEKLEPNSTVAATEKHYPVAEIKGNTVTVR